MGHRNSDKDHARAWEEACEVHVLPDRISSSDRICVQAHLDMFHECKIPDALYKI